MRAFDVIGDVHGHAGKLRDLLRTLGYRRVDGSWAHPERTAVFIGDLIDRGPGQLETVDIARAMVDRGRALMVMGNHEYNAIGWATPHPDTPGDHLRTRIGDAGEKHRTQHKAFLDEVERDWARHDEIIQWFKTIPLWLDLGDVRFVHACWDRASIGVLDAGMGADHCLTDEILRRAADKDTPEHGAIETLLKGPEVPLPGGSSYNDKDGHPRENARYAWWNRNATTYRHALVIPSGVTAPEGCESDEPLTSPCEPYRDAVPLFVGHYWQTGTPAILSEHVACVDYSAGKGGPLVAYRWDGERSLRAEKFVEQK